MTIFFPPEQEKIFPIMFVLGVFISVIYDLFSLKRHITGNNSLSVFLDDVVFSITSITLFLMTVFVVNNGIFRWFEVVSCFVGLFLYHLSLSRLFLKFAYALADILMFAFKKILNMFFYPFMFLCKHIFYPIINNYKRELQLRRIKSAINGLAQTRKCYNEKRKE